MTNAVDRRGISRWWFKLVKERRFARQSPAVGIAMRYLRSW